MKYRKRYSRRGFTRRCSLHVCQHTFAVNAVLPCELGTRAGSLASLRLVVNLSLGGFQQHGPSATPPTRWVPSPPPGRGGPEPASVKKFLQGDPTVTIVTGCVEPCMYGHPSFFNLTVAECPPTAPAGCTQKRAQKAQALSTLVNARMAYVSPPFDACR